MLMQAGPWGRLWASEFRRLVTDMGYFRSWYRPSTFQPSTLIHIVAHLTCRSWRKGTLHNIHIVLKYGGKYCLWAHWSLLNPHVFNINHVSGHDTCYEQQPWSSTGAGKVENTVKANFARFLCQPCTQKIEECLTEWVLPRWLNR